MYQLPPQLQIIFLIEVDDFLCIDKFQSFVAISKIYRATAGGLSIVGLLIARWGSALKGHIAPLREGKQWKMGRKLSICHARLAGPYTALCQLVCPINMDGYNTDEI